MDVRTDSGDTICPSFKVAGHEKKITSDAVTVTYFLFTSPIILMKFKYLLEC